MLNLILVTRKFGNGTQIPISSVGFGSFTTYNHQCMLSLVDLLHIPHASTNLLSINRLCYDNNFFVEFHSSFFLVKDLDTRKMIHHSSSEKGVYKVDVIVKSPNLSSCVKNNFQLVHVAFKASLETWYERMGHTSFAIIQQALN